jgi:hypothetical protein
MICIFISKYKLYIPPHRHTRSIGFVCRAVVVWVGKPAGSGNDWHHIVEQCQGNSARSGFAVTEINRKLNLIKLDKPTHRKITRYYQSPDPYTSGNQTVRNWLNGKSFEFQLEFGIARLKELGVNI